LFSYCCVTTCVSFFLFKNIVINVG
jgi:hypothetical protein